MRMIRRFLLLSLLSFGAGSAFALAYPSIAEAEKLPVDCSGRKSSCTDVRSCSQWINHVCYEYTTTYWYWYF